MGALDERRVMAARPCYTCACHDDLHRLRTMTPSGASTEMHAFLER